MLKGLEHLSCGKKAGRRRWEAKRTGRVNLKKNGLREIIKIYKYCIEQARLFSVVSSAQESTNEKNPEFQLNIKPPIFIVMAESNSGKGFPELRNPHPWIYSDFPGHVPPQATCCS